MLKKFFYVSLIASAFVFGNVNSSAETSAASNYFRIEVIAGVKYLLEYNDDGALVNITEIED